MKMAYRGALVVLCLLVPACLFKGSEEDAGGDGDSGEGDGDGAGGLSGDGDTTPSGGSSGDGDGAGGLSGDGDAARSGGTSGDGDGDGAGTGGAGTGGVGSGGSTSGCVVDLECDVAPLPTTGDFGQDCVNRINQFRACFCDDDGQPLEPLIRWTEAEACAAANAEYDAGTGEAHSGWPDTACPDDSGPLSSEYAGWATNECPGWGSEEQVVSDCLASMYSEGADWEEALGRNPMQSDYQSCSGGCYSQYGHFIAMTKASHTHVACGAFETSGGEVWSVQNFK